MICALLIVLLSLALLYLLSIEIYNIKIQNLLHLVYGCLLRSQITCGLTFTCTAEWGSSGPGVGAFVLGQKLRGEEIS